LKTTAPPGGALPAFLALVFCASVNHLGAQTLPSPWNHSDIGSPATEGRASVASDIFTVEGAGISGGSGDELHFVHQQITGDVELIARVNSLEDVDPWSKAGVMIRDGLGARVRHAFMFVAAGKGMNFERRREVGDDTLRTSGGTGAAPLWVRLVRTGNVFAAYRSATGSSWTLVGRETIAMQPTAYVGLAVASDVSTRSAKANFSSVSVRASGALPAPWLSKDIGAVEAGAAKLSSGVFTVSGAGLGIGGTSDQFHFAFQPVRGDIEIIARLASLGGTDGQAKAGVMIRADLTTGSAHATMLGTVLSGWEFQRRLTAREKSFRSGGPAGRAPGWVRVVREGALFTAYYSADGARWTLVASDRITMPENVYIGLAVSSDNSTTLAAATFANVLVRRPTAVNDPPSVSIVNPSAGERFAIGASIAIKVTATDADGIVAAVDFYRGSTMIASDTTSPYGATWSSPTAGTHTLSAVARDSDGATTAASVTIVVGTSTKPVDSRLIFVPSADHARNVSSYTLAIYRSSDPLTVVPLKKMNLGKPAPVAGEIEVDISAVIGTLGPGTYKGVVTAHNAEGATASSPSPYFVK
jgi:regulation of enolase protein 1 (concanavalin A-like superfamily)